MKKLISLFLLLLAFSSCKSEEIKGPKKELLVFSENFEKPDRRWKRGKGEGGKGQWIVRNGALHIENAKNDPFWLDLDLPQYFRINFNAQSHSKDGDIKFELMGDGENHSSGYIFIFGGWKNSLDVIARLDEHGKDRKAQPSSGVQPGKIYHFSVVRQPSADQQKIELRWEVDGKLKMTYIDKKPLSGEKHRHFAFSNWQSSLSFSALKIYEKK